jgi:uncharacterized protein (TIGR00251 family)
VTDTEELRQALSQSNNLVRIRLRVYPRSRKTLLDGILDGALRLRVQAPPVDGKANLAVLKFLAKALRIPRSHLEITAGLSNRSKTVSLSGLDLGDVCRRLIEAS